jgi:subtilase family serine protease
MARSRKNRSRLPLKLQLSACLERLEDRQLLSASALAPAHSALGQTAQPAGLVVLQPNAATVDAIYTPAQIRTAYGASSIANGGAGTTVAIIDAYKDPDITTDLGIFSTNFGLPQMDGVGSDPKFTILVPTGQTAPRNAPADTWAVEESLDVEYVHTIAPYANIDLIEATNNSTANLYSGANSAVKYAKSLAGVDVLTNSYGGAESAGETAIDSVFSEPASHNPVAIVYSTGDSAAPGKYPAFSPDVVAVGGTSLYTLSTRGIYGSEAGWADGGGGVSSYESTPSYQSSNGVNYGNRSIPDVSMDADPNTGVLVIDQYDYPGEYIGVGGTSLSAPMFGGVIALADQARIAAGGTSLSTTGVLTGLYSTYNSASYLTNFHDVTTGNNGNAAGTGYDLVTGVGTPKIPALVPTLAAVTDPGPLVDPSPPVSPGPVGGLGAAIVLSGSSPIEASFAGDTMVSVPTSNGVSTPFTVTNMSVTTSASPLMNTGAASVAVSASSQAAVVQLPSLATGPVHGTSTVDAFQNTVETSVVTSVFAAPAGVDVDGALSDSVAPAVAPVGGSFDAALPAALSGSVSDAVFADRTAESIFDSMASTPVVAATTDESHTVDLAMIAGIALAVHGVRKSLGRTEEDAAVAVLPA